MDKCVLWTGRKRKASGIGFLTYEGKGIDATRYVYQLAFGKIEKGMCVRHKCKNVLCINLDHLYLEPKVIPLKERFFKYVIIPKNNNLCWIWIGKKDKDGYGNFQANFLKTKRAHRVSYFLHHGEFDKNLLVCHTCDNPSCVNPSHLWLGTTSENAKDSFLKKRSRPIPPVFYGEANNKAKLCVEEIPQIRRLRKEGKSYMNIAKLYGVRYQSIRAICLRETWKHVP